MSLTFDPMAYSSFIRTIRAGDWEGLVVSQQTLGCLVYSAMGHLSSPGDVDLGVGDCKAILKLVAMICDTDETDQDIWEQWLSIDTGVREGLLEDLENNGHPRKEFWL